MTLTNNPNNNIQTSPQECPTTKSTIRIAIVEDEPLWQQGIQTLLSLDKTFSVTVICGTAHEALDKLQPDVVDVVLMDYQLGGAVTGIDVAQALLERGYVEKQIILITGSPAEQLPANNYGYVCKPQIASQLISAIQAVSQCHENSGN